MRKHKGKTKRLYRAPRIRRHERLADVAEGVPPVVTDGRTP